MKKDNFWSPRLKGLGIAAGVATVGALASWYFDINPLDYLLSFRKGRTDSPLRPTFGQERMTEVYKPQSSFGKGQTELSRGPIFGPENIPEGHTSPTDVPVTSVKLNNIGEVFPSTTQVRSSLCYDTRTLTVFGTHASGFPYSSQEADLPYNLFNGLDSSF